MSTCFVCNLETSQSQVTSICSSCTDPRIAHLVPILYPSSNCSSLMSNSKMGIRWVSSLSYFSLSVGADLRLAPGEALACAWLIYLAKPSFHLALPSFQAQAMISSSKTGQKGGVKTKRLPYSYRFLHVSVLVDVY